MERMREQNLTLSLPYLYFFKMRNFSKKWEQKKYPVVLMINRVEYEKQGNKITINKN